MTQLNRAGWTVPHSKRLRRSIVLVTAAGVSVATAVGYAGTPAVLGRDVAAAERIPADEIDHSTWNTLLSEYVDGHGMVDYAGWQANPADVQALDSYLGHLSAASFSRQTDATVRLAFWINAYNAVTIKGILREYPTTSIRNHTARLFGYNIWKDLKLMVDGRAYSLKEIENDVLRKFGEPRIHFAIVCASIGCPKLLNQAYTPDRIDEQLTTNALAFFSDPTKFRYDASRRSIAISPILSWFAEDFGKNRAEQLQGIAPYLPDPAARQLAERGELAVRYLDYDWGLNDQSRASSRQRRTQ